MGLCLLGCSASWSILHRAKAMLSPVGSGPGTSGLEGQELLAASQVALVVKNPAANAGDVRDTG